LLLCGALLVELALAIGCLFLLRGALLFHGPLPLSCSLLLSGASLVNLTLPISCLFLLRGAPLLCGLVAFPHALLLCSVALLDRLPPFRGTPLLNRAGLFCVSGPAILGSLRGSGRRSLGRANARWRRFSARSGRFCAAIDLR